MMDPISSVALASGLSWASGLRLYLTIFIVGLLAKFNIVQLPEALHILSHPLILGAAGFMCMIEFLADKIPYIDSAWDSIQTFIRIPVGALLAIGAINSSDPAIIALTALLGGSLTGMTHATKAGTRAMVNTSPEPVTNIATSFGEEGLFLAGGWLALVYPYVFLSLLLMFILIMLWILPKIWRGVRSIFTNIGKIPRLPKPEDPHQ